MEISLIKKLTENYKIKGILSFFWDFDLGANSDSPNYLYRNVLVKQTYQDIYEVFNDIRDVFVHSALDHGELNRKDERRELRVFSRILYDDENYWEKGTQYEADRLLKEKMDKELEERYNQLCFLYDFLGVAVRRNKKHDFVFKLARNEEISSLILTAKEEHTLEKETVYDICERVLLRDFDYDSFSWNKFTMMWSISQAIYRDKEFWMKKNNLDSERIKNKFLHATEGDREKEY